jgi:hypothetical protein
MTICVRDMRADDLATVAALCERADRGLAQAARSTNVLVNARRNRVALRRALRPHFGRFEHGPLLQLRMQYRPL